MNPIQAAKAIARIEAQIAGASPPANQPKIPSAPPPITPVGGSNVVTKDPDKMSQKEYEKWRVANGARRF
jgi:hypothetical protein